MSAAVASQLERTSGRLAALAAFHGRTLSRAECDALALAGLAATAETVLGDAGADLARDLVTAGRDVLAAETPLDASSQSVVEDEVRAYRHAPLGLLTRAASYDADAQTLREMGESADAAQYAAIAAALRRVAR